MKNYTEEDLRKAFRAGSDYTNDEFFPAGNPCPDEDEYIKSLNPEPEEETIPLTYAYLSMKLGWEDFCLLTGTNIYAKREGHTIENSEIFHIPLSKAERFNLL